MKSNNSNNSSNNTGFANLEVAAIFTILIGFFGIILSSNTVKKLIKQKMPKLFKAIFGENNNTEVDVTLALEQGKRKHKKPSPNKGKTKNQEDEKESESNDKKNSGQDAPDKSLNGSTSADEDEISIQDEQLVTTNVSDSTINNADASDSVDPAGTAPTTEEAKEMGEDSGKNTHHEENEAIQNLEQSSTSDSSAAITLVETAISQVHYPGTFSLQDPGNVSTNIISDPSPLPPPPGFTNLETRNSGIPSSASSSNPTYYISLIVASSSNPTSSNGTDMRRGCSDNYNNMGNKLVDDLGLNSPGSPTRGCSQNYDLMGDALVGNLALNNPDTPYSGVISDSHSS